MLTTLAGEAQDEPVLLVLDEFPELLPSDPTLEQTLRAVWDEVVSASKLRLLLCGSAVRIMQRISEERSPLYGRFDLRMLIHPFKPHEASRMLGSLEPADRARVWGICGGIPLYLRWWDQHASLVDNLQRLVCTPGTLLRAEGDLILATEGSATGLSKQILSAVAMGKNRHSEITDTVGSPRQVSRVLDDLEEMRLLERVVPVTEDPRTRTGRTTYRLADNFLAFWLTVAERYSGEIDRGLGRTIAKVLVQRLDDFMGPRYEEAFRSHLRRLVGEGEFGEDVTAVGPFWTRGRDQVEIDAVVLAGIQDEAVAIGECKWASAVDGVAIRNKLEPKSLALPKRRPGIEYIVCAREAIHNAEGVRPVTASDIFD